MQKVQDDVVKLWGVVKARPEITKEQKTCIKALYKDAIRSLCQNPKPEGGVPRSRRSLSQFICPQISSGASVSVCKIPLLHFKHKVGNDWEYSSNLIGIYLDILQEIATSDTTFKDKDALLTGVGKGSIGIEILKNLSSGSAHVAVTTSCYNGAAVEYYQSIFQTVGGSGSALTVVPSTRVSSRTSRLL